MVKSQKKIRFESLQLEENRRRVAVLDGGGIMSGTQIRHNMTKIDKQVGVVCALLRSCDDPSNYDKDPSTYAIRMSTEKLLGCKLKDDEIKEMLEGYEKDSVVKSNTTTLQKKRFQCDVTRWKVLGRDELRHSAKNLANSVFTKNCQALHIPEIKEILGLEDL